MELDGGEDRRGKMRSGREDRVGIEMHRNWACCGAVVLPSMKEKNVECT